MAERKKEPVRKRRGISMGDREELKRLCLMDNDFMNVALENNIPCVEEMLRVILGRDDLIIKKVRTQSMLQGFLRSVQLDIDAEDSKNCGYDIEIQQASEGADPRRARFHGAMMDSRALKKGQDFKELPERYVIFITRDDVLGMGKTIYTIHKYIDGELKPFDDGSHTIYVNGAAEDDGSDLWKLIHDLKCENPDEMYFPRLAARVRFLKEDEEGIETMSSYFEEQRRKAVEEAVKKAEARAEAKIAKAEARAEKAEAKAEKKAQENFAMRLIRRGKDTLNEIAECSGLTLQRVRALAKTAAL